MAGESPRALLIKELDKLKKEIAALDRALGKLRERLTDLPRKGRAKQKPTKP
jgi:hypothetical protein